MTSTLSPYDTGDIRLGEGTRDLTYLTQRPNLRRPDATGEFPLYQPKTIGDVDQLARLALEATLVHEVPLPPIDSLPEAVRRPAPTTHRAGPSLAEVMPQPDKRPKRYRSRHRMQAPPVAARWAWLLLGLGAGLMSQAVGAGLAVLAVAR